MTSFLLRAHLALGATMAASALVPTDAQGAPAVQAASADGEAPALATVDLDADGLPAEKLLSPLSLLRGIWR